MGVPGNADLLLLKTAAAAGGYQVSRSLRFNSPDSAYLSKNFASAGNRKTFTWSAWIKRSRLAGFQVFFSAADASSEPNIDFDFNASDKLRIRQTTTGGAEQFQLLTTQVFRDISAWYHIVIAFDTTQATASNRIKLYVNGSQVTAFDTSSYPSQNLDTHVTGTAYQHAYGRLGGYSDYYFDGYLAECHLIDGQQLDASSFGSTDATTGQWIPKLYSGSYGSQGFKLTFADNSAATAAALGKDTANSNNWTPNNFSVTAGAGNDSLTDTPTSYGTDTGAGGEVRGNYATLNPIAGGGGTLANGNLEVSTSTDTPAVATQAMTTGKWYWEFTLTTATNVRVGVYNIGAAAPTNLGGTANGWAIINNPSRTYYNGTLTSYGSFSGASGNVVMVAYDADAGKIWFGENGTWLASGNPATGSNPSFSSVTGSAIVPAACSGGGSNVFNFNAGQRAFAYTAPSGFKALCDTNLPAPVVAKPNTVMDALLYTGNGGTQTVSGLQFSPDLVWTKARSAANSHALWDTVRGVEKRLMSNATDAEASRVGGLTAFTSSGFTHGNDGTGNDSGTTYVAWTWDAGTSTVTNTQGSITSSVRANASAGFSICTFTGNSTGGATVGHGLGVAPQLIFVKSRSNSYNWCVYAKAANSGNGQNGGFYLNLTDAWVSDSGFWNNTAANSTTFTLGAGFAVNNSGATYVAYAFSPVAGYSSFGSYTGNGSSTDGPFVFTGHRSRWILIKQSSSAGENWAIFDTARDAYNVASTNLFPNLSSAEASASFRNIDILSNGFKIRNADGTFNTNGATYIWASFAESPFAYARAR